MWFKHSEDLKINEGNSTHYVDNTYICVYTYVSHDLRDDLKHLWLDKGRVRPWM